MTVAAGILWVRVWACYGYGYGHAMGTYTGVRVAVDVNFFMRCTRYTGFHVLIYICLYTCAGCNLPLCSSLF